MVTCLTVVQVAVFVVAAEFLWNYNFDFVNGEYVPASFWKKLATSGTFVAAGVFFFLARYAYERRLVHQIDYLGDDKLAFWFYDVLCRREAMTLRRSDIVPGTFLDAGNYYKFRLKNRRLWFLVDKRGKIEDLETFERMMRGGR